MQLDTNLIITIAEYVRLKEEQLRRIGDRDHLLYANLVASAALWAFALEHDRHAIVLIALPVVSFVLGALHFANDTAVSAIGTYVGDSLSRRLSSPTDDIQLFGWEVFHRRLPQRRITKLFDLMAIVLAYILPGLFGISFLFAQGALATTLSLVGATIGGVLLLILLGAFVGEAVTRS